MPASNGLARRPSERPDHHSAFPLAILAWLALTTFGR
jgi:hypothetical protein